MEQTPYHVLAIEDDELDIELIERAAFKTGLIGSLRVLRSGDEAQRYLAGEEPYCDRARFPLPNLILLDLRLGGKSGLDLLRWIRLTPAFRRLSVIVLSGAATSFDLNRAYELGIEAYIRKPSGLQELATTLAGVLVTLQDSTNPGRLGAQAH